MMLRNHIHAMLPCLVIALVFTLNYDPLDAAAIDRTSVDENAKTKKKPLKKDDRCEVANDNIDSAIRAVLARKGQRPPVTTRARIRDGKPSYIDRMTERFSLTRDERSMLDRQGIVVLAKQEYQSFALAYHEVFQSQLPMFVSIDSIFNAVYQSHDKLVETIEADILLPALKSLIERLAVKLEVSSDNYAADTVEDLTVYLGVARHYLSSGVTADRERKGAVTGRSGERIAFFVGKIDAAAGPEEVELFGRKRLIDFGQFKPRGHYTGYGIVGYFQAAMWLSRVEFNMVSRSCRSSQPGTVPDPSETPREARDAMSLAELIATSGLEGDLARIDRAWSVLAGSREDISMPHISRIMKSAGIAPRDGDAPERFVRAVGGNFRRTLNFHMMPQGTGELPAIATLIGPRIVADSQMLPMLHDPAVPGRYMAGACDVAAALGSDRALKYLAEDIKKHGRLGGQIRAARDYVSAVKAGSDMYSTWLAAIRALTAKPRGYVPSIMKEESWSDMRLNSIIASYAELRHNYVLMAAQDYGFGGCAIPDSFVEPAPDVYDALIAYADNGAKVVKAIDPSDKTRGGAYYRRLGTILRALRAIVAQELENRPLSDDSKRFLGMVVEVIPPAGTGDAPTHTGWYFDLYFNRSYALNASACIADFYTSAYLGKIAYSGINGCRMGLFVVDACGKPRLFAGPVARAFEYEGPISTRMADEDIKKITAFREPWAASYTAYAAPAPELKMNVVLVDNPQGTMVVTAEVKQFPVILEIEYLDHNRKPVFSTALKLVEAKTMIKMPVPRVKSRPEMVHVKIGDFSAWEELPGRGFEFNRDFKEKGFE